MIKKIIDFFQAKKDFKPDLTETGICDTTLYQSRDFVKWNTDLLLTFKGRDIYKRMMNDDQVKPVMQFKIDSITNREFYFDIDPENKQHKEIADFFYYMLDQIKGSLTDKFDAILSALKFGFSIIEKVYKPIKYDGRTYWGIKDLKLRPFDSFNGGIVIDQHGNVLNIEQNVGGSLIKIPRDKVIYFVHQPNVDEHYGESDLKAAYRSYWSKDNIIKFQNIHLERHAGGFMWASVEGKLGPNQEADLKALIRNVSAKMGAIFPKNVTLEQFTPMNTDSFERAVAQHDKAIAKSLLVPNLLGLTEQGNTGSYAQSKTHIDAFLMILKTITNRLADVLNEDVFRELAEWNFGTNDFPKIKFNSLSEDQKNEIIKTWGELIDKGATTKTDEDENHIRRLLSFPEKAKEEEKDVPVQEDIIPELPEDEQIDPVRDQPTDEENKEDSIIDNSLKTEFASKPWLQRIDFAQIKNNLDDADKKHINELNDIMGQVKISLLKQISNIVGVRSLGNVKPNELNSIAIPKKYINELKKTMVDNLNAVVDKEYEQAQKEVPKKEFEMYCMLRDNTKYIEFKKLIPSGKDKTQIENYFKSKSDFFVTGVLQKDVLNGVLNELQSGIKYDKTLKDTIQAIEDNTSLAAVLPSTDAIGRPVNVPLRLENIVRTNTGDALNQARNALFQSDEMKGFVVAFEYSAILDERTSEICDTLNGRIRKDWSNYLPPNHYQCRSILAPVTILDDWSGKEDNIPSGTRPLKGFS